MKDTRAAVDKLMEYLMQLRHTRHANEVHAKQLGESQSNYMSANHDLDYMIRQIEFSICTLGGEKILTELQPVPDPEPVNMEAAVAQEYGAQAELTSEEKIQHSFEQVNRINRDLYDMRVKIAELERLGGRS